MPKTTECLYKSHNRHPEIHEQNRHSSHDYPTVYKDKAPMTQLRVLIAGAGIAGNALAFWLSRLGHSVTVVERHPGLRDAGLQIDLRGAGIEVLRKMGLEDAFRHKSVHEEGVRIVGRSGRQWAYFPANRSGQGLQSFSTDFEIMRGDLCRLLYDASKERVQYVFGTTVDTIQNSDTAVDVVFSNGTNARYDMLVGADGQGSRTRKMILEPGAPDPFQSLGMCTAYFKMPRPMPEGGKFLASAYIAPGRRGLMTRRHSPDEMQAMMSCSLDGAMKTAEKGDVEQEKKAFAQVFQGAGWETDDILSAMTHAEDFYCERLGLVQMESWSSGRVTLLGDAAYCPSALTGMGTTAAMVGAYVLAGEIGKKTVGGRTSSSQAISVALKSYEDILRPFTDQLQKGLSDGKNVWSMFPTSAWGILVFNCIVAVAAFLRLDVIAQWILREDIKGWELPDYEEMVKGREVEE
ncbi:hypothetical protein FE257_010453 [Aspergillus nanangensis]|uniref:FAD-binding domain-containing protein n=1 Tax=Aspergillus nanangensis TaxID=2582783 RepID=A0AAD4CII8_ASPNN|nr:hypothetical protein FE257_010453 [Aspergillus nanangensis]